MIIRSHGAVCIKAVQHSQGASSIQDSALCAEGALIHGLSTLLCEVVSSSFSWEFSQPTLCFKSGLILKLF